MSTRAHTGRLVTLRATHAWRRPTRARAAVVVVRRVAKPLKRADSSSALRASSGDADAERFDAERLNARLESARDGGTEPNEGAGVDAAALAGAVEPDARVSREILSVSVPLADRGTAELFEPAKSDALLRGKFSDEDANVDEEAIAVAACEAKMEKCSKRCPHSDVVMLQAFDFLSATRTDSPKTYYGRLLDRVDFIASHGFTHAWLPPPQLSVDAQGYMPRKLYMLDGSYGSMDELKTLIRALKEAGVKSVCDVVLNHRCAESYDENGTPIAFAYEVSPRGEPIDWGAEAIVRDHPNFPGTGSADSGESIPMAPDLDHTNVAVREVLIEWLEWLHDEIGYSGFRFDFAQGFAPEFLEEYVRETVGKDAFCVAENFVGMSWSGSVLEYNQDKARRVLMDWLAAVHDSSALFDFPTKGILSEAVRRREFWRLIDAQGNPPGLSGWAPQMSVLFVDNHDTGFPQNHWPFPLDRLALGYAYILTHPGICCVYGPHLWCHDPEMCWPKSLPGEIKTLMRIRACAKVCCESTVVIHRADSDIYVATIDDTLIVKLGPRYDVPDELAYLFDGFDLATSGMDYAVWMRQNLIETP